MTTETTGKLIRAAAIVVLAAFAAGAACLYFDVPARWQKPRSGSVKQTYTCPMHADIVQDHAADCPKCGMALVSAGQQQTSHEQCGNSGEMHPGCCADKSAAKPAAPLKLPPGHPPIHGWTTDASSENEPASTNTAPHAHH